MPETLGVSPESAVADTSVPAATPSSEASSLPTQESFSSEVAKASSPAALRGLMANLAKVAPKPAAKVEAAPTPKAGDVPAEAPAAETPASPEGETPEPEAPEPTPETPAEADDDAGNEDFGPVTPSKASKLRLRLQETDTVGRLAASYLQRNRDWTLEQATDAARSQLGIKSEPKGETPATATPPKPKSDLPDSVEGVDHAVDTLETERTKAITELRFEDVDKIDRQLRRLDRHRSTVEKEADQRQVQEASAYESAFTASESRASELYDFASKPDSDGGKRMVEIDNLLKANGDPLYNSPDKPLRVAQMVATELRIAPKRKGPAPVTPVKPAPTAAVPAQKKQVLPGGSSSTTPASVNPHGETNAKIGKVSTVQGLRDLTKSLGIKLPI